MDFLCDPAASKTKKASGSSPTRHDYRQPKVEEGTDAFWQVRKKIEMSSIGRRIVGGALLWPSVSRDARR
jgi:hypothetical protein